MTSGEERRAVARAVVRAVVRAVARAVARAMAMAVVRLEKTKLVPMVEVRAATVAVGVLLAECSQCHTCACSSAASKVQLMRLCKHLGT